MRILLVEDEEMLSNIVAKGLRTLGYAVDPAYDGEEALYNYGVNEYDLIILDLNIPIIDGIDVLQKIRETDTKIRILILSARTSIDDRIDGLDKGANDYLIKPFDFGELAARVRNLLRQDFTQVPSVIRAKGISIDTKSKEAAYNNQVLSLTRKEYSILEYLIRNKNTVISAEQLVEHIWDNEFDPFSNALRYHICTLKKKLSDASPEEIVTTVRGHGYMVKENTDEIV